jgi:hypothetical protein
MLSLFKQSGMRVEWGYTHGIRFTAAVAAESSQQAMAWHIPQMNVILIRMPQQDARFGSGAIDFR